MRFLKHVKGFITFGVGQIPDDGTILVGNSQPSLSPSVSFVDGCFSILAGKLNKINPEPWIDWIAVRRKC